MVSQMLGTTLAYGSIRLTDELLDYDDQERKQSRSVVRLAGSNKGADI